MTSPFSITASPTVVRAAPGSTAAVRVYDTGTAPLKVTASLEPVVKASGKCTVNATAVRDVTLTGRRVFTRSRAGTPRQRYVLGRKAPGQDLAVVFSGSPGAGGNVRVTGAVGAPAGQRPARRQDGRLRLGHRAAPPGCCRRWPGHRAPGCRAAPGAETRP